MFNLFVYLQIGTCVEVIPYSGQVCTSAFTSLLTCLFGESPVLNIPLETDQQQGDNDVLQLLNAFHLYDPAPECSERIHLFLCLHVFGVCDTFDEFHTTQRRECFMLRDDVCSSEWALVISLLPNKLPICESLPDINDQCTGTTISDR